MFSALLKGLSRVATKQIAKKAAKVTARELARGAVSSLGSVAVEKAIG